ncbi:uncharacterized protein LOC114309115 [Camellia sinensis]|uniref:uncharacterized protein LOC114309115 n=1 Tax=Camellia sinensis TaxID=4442 RepID=UPI001035CFD1|nr:uncharacterized protein LOC114309115 [Camellia sinensis]
MLFRETKGCVWNVHGRVENANGFFYIRKLNNAHTYGAEVHIMNHSCINSDLVVDLIVEGVRDNPLTRPVHAIRDFKLGYGLRVSYLQAWLGVEKAKGDIFGDYLMSFDQLRWYVDVAKSCNLGSYIEFECDNDSKLFKRLFVAFHNCISGFDYYRPLLFLDGTFFKRRFRGNLLAVIGKDGNQRTQEIWFFPVCFTIVGLEHQDNWCWVLEHLSSIVSSGQNITFVLDCNLELLEVLPKVFPMAFHAYCLYHLKMNLRHHLHDCNVDGDSDVVLPPLSRKQPGRPNKKMIRSNSEKVRQIICGRCGKVGNHNKKLCKEAL